VHGQRHINRDVFDGGFQILPQLIVDVTSVTLEIEKNFFSAHLHGLLAHGLSCFIERDAVTVFVDLLHDLFGVTVADDHRVRSLVTTLTFLVNDVLFFEVGVRAKNFILPDEIKDCPVLFEAFINWGARECELPLSTLRKRACKPRLGSSRFFDHVCFVSDDHH